MVTNVVNRAILEVLRYFLFTIWVFVGATFWIPFLARMIAVFTIGVLSAVSRGTSMGNAEVGLDAAVKFYIKGFEKIHDGIENIINGVRVEDDSGLLDEQTVVSLIIQLVYTMVFWGVVGFLVWTIGVMG